MRVLGPMSTGERTLSPRERAILSALIVFADVGARADELADAYWGERVPATWAQQVKTAVARIRSALGAEAVRTVSGGYVLGLDPDLVDAVRFERAVSAARSHALRGEPDRALDVYRRGLALWRGDAYPDLANWTRGAAEAARLAEIRMAAEEEVLDCRLALGDHRAVIPDAERLVRAAPLREERWAVLALACYRSGRQSEALAALRSARARLEEDLGIDVGHRLSELETAILRQDASLDAPIARPEPSVDCPYQGLEAFGIGDAEEYFGRDAEAEAILERLRPGSLLALAGASGSGKSSLAMAGVLRRVIDRDIEARVLRPAQLDELGVLTLMGVALVDQFEELFQLDPADVDRLAGVLRAHVEAGGTVFVTVRSDFLDRCLSHPDLATLFSDRVVAILPMTREQLQDVIERPAERAGLRVERGLTELILRDAADHPAALPLLSHALAETWARREAGVLTVDGYRATGGLAGAVANSAERLFQSWDASEQAACHALMLRLVDRGADAVIVRRVVPLRGLRSDPVRAVVIAALAGARLLSIDVASVAISHETLVDAWPRLAGWLIDDAEDSRMLAAVSTASEAWMADGRSSDDLLHGARLQAALDWNDSFSPDLTAEEKEFLDSSRQRGEAASRELEQRAARDRRQNRRLRWAIGGAAILLVAAVVAGGLAAVRGQEAEAAAENAQVEAVVATSLSLIDHDRELAALLAAEAFRRWPDDPRARSALWGIQTSSGGLVDVHRDDEAYMPAMAMIPRTRTALRVWSPAAEPAEPATAELIDVTTGEVVTTLDLDLPASLPDAERTVAVSADGSTAAIQSAVEPDAGDSRPCCWSDLTFVDLATGEELSGSGIVRAPLSTSSVLDGEGRTLYAAQPDTADLVAVDTTTGEVRASDPSAFTDNEFVYRDPGVAILEDGLVAIGASDHIRLYDPATLALARTIPLQGDVAGWDVISDGQGGIIAGGEDGMVRLSLVSEETIWRRQPDPTRRCLRLYLASRSTVACGSYDGVALLDLNTGETASEVALQTAFLPVFETIDDDSLLAYVARPPAWVRLRIDGGSAGADVVAKGRELVYGLDEPGSLAVTRQVGGGPMRLWDLERDVPVGQESDRIVPLGSGIVARYADYDESGGVPRLEELATGQEVPLDIPGLPEKFEVMPGTWASPAFAWWSQGVVAFDPSTGDPLGPVMRTPGGVFTEVSSVSETPDLTRALISWYDASTDVDETAVFELGSGQILARGLKDVDYTVVLDGEQFIGVALEYARRFDIRTLKPISVLARAIGGGMMTSASADGTTLLNVGFGNALTLYRLDADITLASPIDSPSSSLRTSGRTRIPGGFLSADGGTLLEALTDGIRVWDLHPAAQAAHACALAGRELSKEEWSTYFPGEQQVATCAALRSASSAAEK